MAVHEKMPSTYAKQPFFATDAAAIEQARKTGNPVLKQAVTNQYGDRAFITIRNNKFYETGTNRSEFIQDFIKLLEMLIKHGRQNKGALTTAEMTNLQKINMNLQTKSDRTITDVNRKNVMEMLESTIQICNKIHAQSQASSARPSHSPKSKFH